MCQQRPIDSVESYVDIITTLFMLTANMFILYATARYRRRQMTALPHSNKAAVLLIVNLSTADLLIAFSFLLLFIPQIICANFVYLQHHMTLCILTNVPFITGHFTSWYTLVAIAADRYIAVVYSLRYGEIMSTRRTLLAIAAIWTVATFQATMLLYWNIWRDGLPCGMVLFAPLLYIIFAEALNVSLVILSLAVIYWRIVRVVTRVSARNQKSARRSTWTVLLILLVYTAAWTPYFIIVFLSRAGYHVHPVLFIIDASLVQLNYVANPFIYALNTRPIKYCLLEAFPYFKKSSSQNIDLKPSPQVYSIRL